MTAAGISVQLGDKEQERPWDALLDSLAEGRTVFEMVCLDAQREVSAEAAGLAHQLAGGLPHWIRVLAERSRSAGEGEGLVSVEIVAAECERLLSRANRHLFEEEGRTHFERRYAPEERLVARDVLVHVARAEPALRQGVVAALLSEGADKPRIERVLDRLLDEFYLEESEGSLRFVVPLMMRWFVRWA